MRRSVSLALGPENLLSIDLGVVDCPLDVVRNEPVDELLTKLLLHMRIFRRIYPHNPILVEQQFVALHYDHEVGFVLERNPRAPSDIAQASLAAAAWSDPPSSKIIEAYPKMFVANVCKPHPYSSQRDEQAYFQYYVGGRAPQ